MTLIFPSEYIGSLVQLCNLHRGKPLEQTYLDESRIILKYCIPLSEILVDFHNQVKSKTAGYASFDWEEAGYQEADLCKVNFALNGKIVDALSCIVPRSSSTRTAREGVQKLKTVLNRGLIDIAIQGFAGGKVIARESIKALSKNVTAKW